MFVAYDTVTIINGNYLKEKQMRNIAIITARSGSKGLPDKNIKELKGKPLMAYSIECALESDMFDEVMVSTDSEKYAEIARKYGANVPFLRSENNSGDKASSWDVVKEVLDNYKKQGKEFDTVCLLQPTSPLREARDIQEAYKLYEEKAKVAVISVCEMEHSPLWSNVLPEDHSLEGFEREGSDKPRQELETYYRINGALYIVSVNELYKGYNFMKKGSYAYSMPIERSIDIDTELDFKYAEFLINHSLGQK